MIDFRNVDCMVAMKEYPDKYFDLAIVDPIYGGVTKGGYMYGKGGENLAKRKDYHFSVWEQEKTPPEYFAELFRVSKNQIIWGGELLYNIDQTRFPRLGRMGQTAPRRRTFCGLRTRLDIF